MYRLSSSKIDRVTRLFVKYNESEKVFVTKVLPVTAITCLSEVKSNRYLSHYIESFSPQDILITKQLLYGVLNHNIEGVLSVANAHGILVWQFLDNYLLTNIMEKVMRVQYISTEVLLNSLSSSYITNRIAFMFLDHLCARDLNLSHTSKLKKEYISYMWKHVVSDITAKALVLNIPSHDVVATMNKKDMFSPAMYKAVVNRIIANDQLLNLIELRGDPKYEYNIMKGIHGDCYIWVMTWYVSKANPVSYLDLNTAFTPISIQTGNGWGGFFASLTYHKYVGDIDVINNAISYITDRASGHSKLIDIAETFRL